MNMFKATTAKNPEEYIEKIIDEDRKSEINKLDQLIKQTLPNLESYIISGMIGYGKFHYKSKSGRVGDWCIIALASQKNYISVYACGMNNGKYIAEKYADKLGTKDKTIKHPKVSVGKSCISFKKIADLDMDVFLTVLIEAAEHPGFES